jgi:GNAT superfamily N-acetyltransferase
VASAPDPFTLEHAAARAWAAAEVEERDGWLLRSAPRVPHRRSNSALPALPAERAGPLPLDTVEGFYDARGADPIVAVAPAEEQAALDVALAAAGWTAEGHTNVLVARAAEVVAAEATVAAVAGAREPAAVEGVDPFAWPDEAVREDVIAHARGDVLAFAEGQRGAVLCVRTGGIAGVFRLHVAPQERGRGVGARLLAACATAAPVLYAQVEAGNVPAERLFARAGFRRSHGYHYRRRPRPPVSAG